MLFNATLIVDLIAMATTLWGAFYLFARGFSSWITLRAVIILLLLSIFFFGAYNNLFHQVEGTAALRAVLLILGLSTWYSLTYRLMSQRTRQKLRWMAISIFVLGGVTAITLLIVPSAFIEEKGNDLYIAHMKIGLPYILYGIFQLLIVLAILYNLLAQERIGLTRQGKYFLVASFFPVLAMTSGVIGLAISPDVPRLITDLLTFGGMFLLGISVARHQTMIERRTTIQELPVSLLTIVSLTGAYAYLAAQWGVPMEKMGAVVAFAILTHSLVDLVRESLERQRIRNESAFRYQFRELENQDSPGEGLESRLQEGLELLCHRLSASGGFIAVRNDESFDVVATKESIEQSTKIPAEIVLCDDLLAPTANQLARITWIAPAFEGPKQVAVIGIGRHRFKPDYSTGDLDLLADVAEHIGMIVSLNNRNSGRAQQILQLVSEVQSKNTEMSTAADEMIASISASTDVEFVKLVEEALRHYSDYIALGQSPLGDWAGMEAASHVERGKQLQMFLAECIDLLRPAGTRPPEPVPRVWYSYVVLHDAYVEGVPNREIMARLYISEGTFNRTRRNALRGLARLMSERMKTTRNTLSSPP
ncbi:MAG TPA: hypothetical protein VK909_20480 [Anaerolineales bacterium]|nr:hypothetical protein [Anaerolineales bacterium]